MENLGAHDDNIAEIHMKYIKNDRLHNAALHFSDTNLNFEKISQYYRILWFNIHSLRISSLLVDLLVVAVSEAESVTEGVSELLELFGNFCGSVIEES